MLDSETQLCPKCGATVRRKASFCFKCGTPIMIKPVIENTAVSIANESESDPNRAEISNVWFQETIVEGSNAAPQLNISTTESEVEENPADEVSVDDEEVTQVVQAATPKVWSKKKKKYVKEAEIESELISSEVKLEETSVPARIEAKKIPTKDELAKLRAAKSGKKPIEIIWEEPDSNPTWKFLLATILFTAIAVAIAVFSRMLK